MNQSELLQKALETADLIAGGGELNPEQSEKFITFLQDQSIMAKDARIIRMKTQKREINKMGIGQRASVPAKEATDPGVRQKPSFSKVVLDTVGIMTPFEISYESFEDNIMGDNLEDEVIKLFATQIATDHEELYILGDTASADPYLALTDGWHKLAVAGGHVFDQQGGGVSTDVLGELLNRIPEKFMRNFSELRYYVSPKFEHAYKKILGQRPTPAGDKFLLTETPATYAGIPLIRVPMIPSNLSATIVTTTFTDLSFVILTLRKNLVVGIHRAMTLERDRNIFARVRQYAFTSRVDATFEEVDAVAIAENVSIGA